MVTSLVLSATVLLAAANLGIASEEPSTSPPGPASCTTFDDFERLVENVVTNCCDQFDQEANCDDTTVNVCDTRCAPVFVEFWAACSAYIQTSLPSPALRQQFTSTQSKCHATLQANQLHDTDLVKPGDQVDMTTPLHAPVNCHNIQMKTANDLDENTGPDDSLWMVSVLGDARCLEPWRIVNSACTCAECNEANDAQQMDSCTCPNTCPPGEHSYTCGGCARTSNHGYKTLEERDACEAKRNKDYIQAELFRRYGNCVEHRPPPPPPPPPGEHGHDLVDAIVHTMSTGGISGYSTYALMLDLPQPDYSKSEPEVSVENVYTIYGSPAETAGADKGEPAHVMYFPPAFQEPAPFGADIGGTNPSFWTYSASAQWDSWLSVGITDGSSTTDVSSIGIDFDSWTGTEGLTIDNGAVFWMNPANAPSRWPCVVAQVTVPSGTPWSATVNARGKMAGYTGGGGDDWEATNLVFSDATVPAWEAGGEGQDEVAHPDGPRYRRTLQGQGETGKEEHGGTWPPTGTGCDALVVPGASSVVYSPCSTGTVGCTDGGQTSFPTSATNQAHVTCKSGHGFNGKVITVSCMAGEKMDGLIWKDQPIRPVWELTPLCDLDPDGPPAETAPVRAHPCFSPSLSLTIYTYSVIIVS